MNWFRARFELDTWLARWRVYRWIMFRVFGRRYFLAEYKYGFKPQSEYRLMIFHRRDIDDRGE